MHADNQDNRCGSPLNQASQIRIAYEIGLNSGGGQGCPATGSRDIILSSTANCPSPPPRRLQGEVKTPAYLGHQLVVLTPVTPSMGRTQILVGVRTSTCERDHVVNLAVLARKDRQPVKMANHPVPADDLFIANILNLTAALQSVALHLMR